MTISRLSAVFHNSASDSVCKMTEKIHTGLNISMISSAHRRTTTLKRQGRLFPRNSSQPLEDDGQDASFLSPVPSREENSSVQTEFGLREQFHSEQNEASTNC